MNRRDFLKLAAVGSLAVFTTQFGRKFSSVFPGVIPSGDFSVRLGNKFFKGTSDGRILASADEGLTWHRSARFGEDARVKDLAVTRGWLFAVIDIPGGTFELASRDGIVWRTV